MKRYSHQCLAKGRRTEFSMITDSDCEKIHQATLEILKDTGIKFDSEKARNVLIDAGCWEDDEHCIHFPRQLVEDCIYADPAEFRHCGRTRNDDVLISKNQVYASNFGEGIVINDLKTDERRPTVKQDAVDIARIVDALENIGIYNRAVNPHDVPVETSCLHNTEIAFLYTSKPKHIISSGPYQTKKMIEMAEIACGGKEECRKNPPCAFNSSPVSPLHITANAAETAILVAEAGLPNNIISMVQQGATSPPTFAGSVMLHNAEFLAFNTLLQCVNEGIPVMNGSSDCIMEMRRGCALTGAPESAILNAASIKMSKYYNISSYVSGG
jgi:trimethylamine--corrinoid protein Co-methyltransferase